MRFLLLPVVCALACAAPRPALVEKPTEDPAQAALNERLRRLARLSAGVDAFLADPRLGRAAAQAASQAIALCEEGRRTKPQLTCSNEQVDGWVAVMHRPETQAPLSANVVAWKIVASPSCADLEHVLSAPKVEQPRLTATLELTECSFSSSALPWQPTRCPAASFGAQCPDGSFARAVTNCLPGQPCAQPPPTCPCLSGGVRVERSVRGRVTAGGLTWAIHSVGGGVNSITSNELNPALPQPERALAYWSKVSEGVLESIGYGINALELVHSKPGSDEATIACAENTSRYSSGFFGLEPNGTTCEDVFEREPRAPVVKDTKPRLPTVKVQNGERRLTLLSEDEVIASRNAIEAASPGWKVTVSKLGFITSAVWRTSASTPDDAAVRDFFTRHFRELGFASAPTVTDGGSAFAGPMWRAGPVLAKTGLGDVSIESHAWPFQCPAYEPTKTLAPWLGKPFFRELPGEPCDPAGGASCKSQAPSAQQVPLSVRDVGAVPVVALEPTDGDEVRLRCVVRLSLRGALMSKQVRLPDAVDLETNEAMVGAVLTEDQLR